MHRKLHQILNRKQAFGIIMLCLIPVLIARLWTHTPSAETANPFEQISSPVNAAILITDRLCMRDNPRECFLQNESSIPEFDGVVIDDLSEQFSLRGPERYWHEENQGYGEHSWWTKNTLSGIENVARWSLGITEAGKYDVLVYIPFAHSTTQQARYFVVHNEKQDRITVNQKANRNTWYSLGEFNFAGTGNEYIELVDETGEANTQYEIAFDAVGYSKSDSKWEDKITGALWERIQPWLEEKTAIIEEAVKDWLNEQKGKLLQRLADTLKNWIDQQCAGLGAAMLFPVLAFVLWQRQRRKPPGSD